MNKINFNCVSLTQALVKCKSVTPKDDGALNIVEDHLNKIGFTCERLSFSEKDSYKVDNLFGKIGKSGKHLAFAGHTDVVPPGNEDSWKFPPFSAKIDNDILYGRGSEDMKGNIACFLSATDSFLKKYGNDFGGQISFIITGDEEKEAVNGTKKIMQWIKNNNMISDHCIVGEPTSEKVVGDKIKIGRRGSINFFIKVKGIQGHTANAHRAENPTHYLVNLLQKIISKPLDRGNEYFLPSTIQIPTFDVGNEASNVIPEIAKATINIRFNNLHTWESLTQWLNYHIKQIFNNNTRAICEFTSEKTGESFITEPTELNSIVANSIKEITGMNKDPIMATDGGTSDARFIKNYCQVLELGIVNKTLHQVDEHVKIDDLKNLKKIYLRILEKYFKKN